MSVLRQFRFPVTVAAIVILLIDIAIGTRMFLHGNKYFYTNPDGNFAIGVVPVTLTDWLVMTGIVLFHAILVLALWWSWSPPRGQGRASN